MTLAVRGLCGALALLLAGCVGVPEGVQPVEGFELERYLGKWHEIARLDVVALQTQARDPLASRCK